MKVEIRKMRAEDFLDTMNILHKWNMAPIIDSNNDKNLERSELDITKSFVAIANNQIVGICSYIIHNSLLAETASLAVDPEYQGLGLGYKLQKARLIEMQQLGIKTLHTETDRAETVQWYIRKFGYQKVGINPKKHDFSLPDVDQWTVLELDLQNWQAD